MTTRKRGQETIEQIILGFTDDELQAKIVECDRVANKPLSECLTRRDLDMRKAAGRVLLRLNQEQQRRAHQKGAGAS